eukprot:2344531-Rhodomonas_salina.1
MNERSVTTITITASTNGGSASVNGGSTSINGGSTSINRGSAAADGPRTCVRSPSRRGSRRRRPRYPPQTQTPRDPACGPRRLTRAPPVGGAGRAVVKISRQRWGR